MQTGLGRRRRGQPGLVLQRDDAGSQELHLRHLPLPVRVHDRSPQVPPMRPHLRVLPAGLPPPGRVRAPQVHLEHGLKGLRIFSFLHERPGRGGAAGGAQDREGATRQGGRVGSPAGCLGCKAPRGRGTRGRRRGRGASVRGSVRGGAFRLVPAVRRELFGDGRRGGPAAAPARVHRRQGHQGARGEETQGGGGGGVQGLAGGVAGRRRGPGHVAVPWLQARAALPPLGAPARQAVPGPGDRPASEYAEQLAQDERGRRREESGAHLGARAVGRLGGPLGGGAEKAGQTRRIDTSGELGVPQPRSAAGRSRSARLCVGARLGLGKRHQGRAPGPCPGRTMRRARRQ
mmetsp:Transcript_29589/g.66320  ORF Transcript_29589/g.66320 Transcript_29589/m.66320 type:complete len:346 (-) Transcript_29589:266-1303(-)